ncbi:unnamed protein product [Chrysoparadoxa australica]
MPRHLRMARGLLETFPRRFNSTSTRAPQPGIAVVGGGRMGLIRARDIYAAPGATLSAFIDDSPAARDEISREYGVATYDNLEEALSAHKEVSGVWISTPTPSHLHLIKQVALARKAVGVEKPVASDVASIKEAYGICDKAGVPLYCSFQRRVDPSYCALAEAVHNGKLGSLRSVSGIFRDSPVPSIEFLKDGGDIFHDLAVHDIDFVRYLVQEEPSRVYATQHAFVDELREVGVQDSAHILLSFPSGLTFTLEMTRMSPYGYDNRIEVCGELGVMEVVNRPQSSLVHWHKNGVMADRPDPSFPERYLAAFALEVAEFIKVLKGYEPLVTCDDSCKATYIAERASQSAKLGVPLPLHFNDME